MSAMPLVVDTTLVDACADPLRRSTALRWLAVAGVFAMAAGCTSMASLMGPQTVEISRDQLVSKLGTQFPMRNQVLDLFEVTAAAPRLTLQPDSNRVLADIDLGARDRIFSKAYQGSLWLSFGLRFEPRDQTIRLQNVTIDKISLSSLPASYERHLTKLGSWLVEDRLQNFVVHRLSPDDLKKAEQKGYSVSDIKITRNGLAIVLQPK
jgi:hypothetical protein